LVIKNLIGLFGHLGRIEIVVKPENGVPQLMRHDSYLAVNFRGWRTVSILRRKFVLDWRNLDATDLLASGQHSGAEQAVGGGGIQPYPSLEWIAGVWDALGE